MCYLWMEPEMELTDESQRSQSGQMFYQIVSDFIHVDFYSLKHVTTILHT